MCIHSCVFMCIKSTSRNLEWLEHRNIKSTLTVAFVLEVWFLTVWWWIVSLTFSCPCDEPCCVVSVMSDSVTPWTVAHQAPLSMGFTRQEYWSGLPCPPPEDLPALGLEPMSLTSPALAGGFFTNCTTWEHPHFPCYFRLICGKENVL